MLRLFKIFISCLFLVTPFTLYSQASAQQQQLPIIGRPPIIAVDWNPKQNLIAVATAKEIWLYDAQLKDVAHLEVQIGLDQWNSSGDKQSISDWNIQKVKWSPNGQWLTMSIIVVTADGKSQSPIWQIWNWDGAQFTRIMDQFEYISAIKWSPNADQYSLTIGDQIFLFDAVSNQPIITFQAVELDWSSDNQHLAVVSLQAIQVYNPQSLNIEATFPDSDAALRFALWNSDNTKIAAVGQNRLYVWDFVTKKTLVNLIHFFPNPYPEMGYGAFREPIRGMIWRPHHDEVTVSYNSITGAEYGRISIWDVIRNIEIYSSVQGGRLVEMRWTPGGRKLISSGATTFKISALLDMASFEPPPKGNLLFTEWSYSPSENHVIGYSHRYNIFSQLDPELFTEISRFSGIANAVQGVSWSSDDERFVVASADELQIWNLSSGKQPYVNIYHNGMYTNPIIKSHDEKYTALVSRNLSYRFSQMCDSVRIWDAKARIPLLSLPANLGTSIYWILNTNLLAIDEINEAKFFEQPCGHPSQFRILNATTGNVILTLNHRQLFYLNWANKILNLFRR